MQVTWKIQGKLMLKHNNSTIGNKFAAIVPLKGVQVKVSAREKLLGVWGPFNSWDTDVTDSNGFFEVKKEKDKSDRQFKIEVLFKDDTLKLYPENDGFMDKVTEGITDLTGDVIGLVTGINVVGDIVDAAEDALQQLLEQTSRIAFDVRWFKILDEDKHDKDHNDGTINFGDFVFGQDSDEDLNNSIAIKHAMVWFVFKEVFNVINNLDSSVNFSDKKPVALKYPHENSLINDNVEAAYSDPYNYIIFIIRNSQSDWLTVDTILHELMHIWAYQHCSSEKAMAWQLAIHGSTHEGLQKKSFVAFHEGFAEWASNRLTKMIFGEESDIYGSTTDTGLPFSRSFLKKKKIKKEADIDKSEYGWISLFNILMTPDLHRYDFNSTTDYAEKLPPVIIPLGNICSSPALSFEEILKIFVVHESKGYKKVLDKNEMTLNDFLDRGADIFDKLTNDHVTAIKNLLNPSKTGKAAEVICLPPPKTKTPGKASIPIKDLKEPPLITKKKP